MISYKDFMTANVTVQHMVPFNFGIPTVHSFPYGDTVFLLGNLWPNYPDLALNSKTPFQLELRGKMGTNNAVCHKNHVLFYYLPDLFPHTTVIDVPD